MNEELIKVLWIEDIVSIHATYQTEAEGHGLFLCPYTNWEDGKKELLEKYKLQCQRKLNKRKAT